MRGHSAFIAAAMIAAGAACTVALPANAGMPVATRAKPTRRAGTAGSKLARKAAAGKLGRRR